LPSDTKSATYLTASCLVTLNLLHILPHPLPSSPYIHHTKNTRVTKTICCRYCTKTKQTCRNACTWWSGECNWWPVSRHEPLDTRAECCKLKMTSSCTTNLIIITHYNNIVGFVNLFLDGLSFVIPYITGLYTGCLLPCDTVLCIRYYTQETSTLRYSSVHRVLNTLYDTISPYVTVRCAGYVIHQLQFFR